MWYCFRQSTPYEGDVNDDKVGSWVFVEDQEGEEGRNSAINKLKKITPSVNFMSPSEYDLPRVWSSYDLAEEISANWMRIKCSMTPTPICIHLYYLHGHHEIYTHECNEKCNRPR